MTDKFKFTYEGKECEGVAIGHSSNSGDYDLTIWSRDVVYYNHQLLDIYQEYVEPYFWTDDYGIEHQEGEFETKTEVTVLYNNVIIPELD